MLERSESLNGALSAVSITRKDDGSINATIHGQNSANPVCVAQATPLRVIESSLFGGDHWYPSVQGHGMTAARSMGPMDC